MTKISIIMPTYNVEKYFRQCIESVINQTLTDIEIIPVDDGSPDNCGKIMDEYAAKDSRIKPIHQKNGGYGKAVNAGIDVATGEYIGIVETDDFIEPDMYEKLYNQAKKLNADVCKSSFYKYNSFEKDENQNIKWVSEIQNIEEYPNDRSFKISEYPRLFMFHSSIWSNIYKSEFLNKNNITINETPSASYQDFPFMAEIMCKAERIAVVHDYLYHWRVEPNQNSSTNQRGTRLLIMPDQCDEVKRIVKENKLYDELKETMYKHILMENSGFYHTIQYRYKKDYYYKIRNLFKEIVNDPTFEYKYFDKKDIDFLNTILKNSYFTYIIKNIICKNILQKLFSVTNQNTHKVITFLGIKFKFKSQKLIECRRQDEIISRLNNINNRLAEQNAKIENISNILCQQENKISEINLKNDKFDNLITKLGVNEFIPNQSIGRSMFLEAGKTTAQYVLKNMSCVKKFYTPSEMLSFAISQATIDGLFLEFGVYSGNTLNHISSLRPEKNFYGFDSFEGLPEDWRSDFEKGTFAKENLPEVNSNVSLIKGWFNDTLPEFIQQYKEPCSFIHIDCDIYSSTKTIFDNLANQIVEGTIIVFDEYFNYPTWEKHEFKAFQEFVINNNIKYKYIGYVEPYEQVAVKIMGRVNYN